MLPVETILAVFPSTARVGTLALRPLTLYHATALDVLGVDITDPDGVDENHVFIAAWMMTLEPDAVVEAMAAGKASEAFEEWMRGIGEVDVVELLKAVNHEISACIAMNVPGASDGREEYAGPRGYGWTLELGEAIAHEYAMSFHEAMSQPLAQIFALIAACRRRNGGKPGGPDYYERVLMQCIKDLKRHNRYGG